MKVSNALLAQDSPTPLPAHGYRSRPLTLPRVPFTVRRQKVERASTVIAMDDSGGMPYGGFLNTGGVGFELFFPGYPYLAMLAQRSEFRQPVETHAKDMTREWIEFKSTGKKGEGDKLADIELRFDELNVQDIFRRALLHDGYFGLGHVFVQMDKGSHEDPLTLEGIEKGTLKGFVNIEPMWTTPLTWNANDPTAPNFYKPESWMVLGRETHQSRLLRFVSHEIPDILKPAFNFGGVSLSQLIEPYVDRWLKTVGSVNKLISNFSIINLQTDMSAVLQGETDSELLKRIKLFARDRDNQGVFLTDKDRELLEQLTVSLAGLSELQAQAQEHMAAPTHLPLVVLTGITPSGLSASSEGEIEVYHDWNRSEQGAVMRDNVKTVLDIVQMDLYGEVDPSITFDFHPIKQITGRARAEIKNYEATAATAYVDMGALRPEEVREKLARDPDSGYSSIDVNDVPEPPEEQDVTAGESDDDKRDAA